MKSLLNVVKGFFVGVANVVAGLSGSTVAIICKVYDDLLEIFSDIIHHPIKVIKKHYLFIIGIVLGIILSAFAFKKLYEQVPFPISLLCAGIVLLGLIPFSKSLDLGTHKILNSLYVIVPFALMVILPFAVDNNNAVLGLNPKDIFIIIGLGFIAASSMILPGLSGSMVLMALGFYEEVLGLITNLFKFLAHKEYASFGEVVVLVIFFVLGVAIGLVVMSKLIKGLSHKFHRQMNLVIFGLIAGSFVAMIIKAIQLNNDLHLDTIKNVIMIVSGIELFVVGCAIGFIMNKCLKGDKMEINKENSLEYANKYFSEFKELLAKLVSYPSVLDEYKENDVEPFGHANKEVLDFMLDYAKKDGFGTLNQDNYAGHIAFGDSKDYLGLLAHLDVVPVTGQKWTSDPFKMVERDGRLYGRGVNDDKGPLAASYIALKILKDLGFKPNKQIKLIMGCDEESGSRCLAHYFKYNEKPVLGFSPDACFPCINGEKAHAGATLKGTLKDSIIESFASGVRFNIVPGEASMKLKEDHKEEFLK